MILLNLNLSPHKEKLECIFNSYGVGIRLSIHKELC